MPSPLLVTISAVPAGLSLAELQAQHPNLARRTLQRQIAQMVASGQIAALGEGRARRYLPVSTAPATDCCAMSLSGHTNVLHMNIWRSGKRWRSQTRCAWHGANSSARRCGLSSPRQNGNRWTLSRTLYSHTFRKMRKAVCKHWWSTKYAAYTRACWPATACVHPNSRYGRPGAAINRASSKGASSQTRRPGRATYLGPLITSANSANNGRIRSLGTAAYPSIKPGFACAGCA